MAAAATVAVVLVFAGWWAIRGPAVVRGTGAPPPEIDIDSPAMRARREAALALATMPGDPWSLAESLAASAPETAPEKEQCGVGDAPQFATPATQDEAPVLTRAASPRYQSAQARMDAALRSSADPLDRAVADFVNTGDMRSAPGRDEAVVQQAITATDPRLYSLGYGLCHSSRAIPPSCARISAARWVQVDPGNGIPWVYLLAQSQAAGDAAGVRDAIAHLASSSRFDLYFNAVAGAVAGHVPDDAADLAAADGLVTKAYSQAAELPFPAYQPLIQACRNHAGGDEQLEQQCRAVSDGMYAHSDTLINLAISGALLLQTTGDASRRDLVRAERAVLAAHWSPATGFSPCQDMREAIKMQLRSAQVGEVEALRERARKVATP